MIATEARMSRIETGRLPQLGWLYCRDDKGLCYRVVQGSFIELYMVRASRNEQNAPIPNSADYKR